MAKYHLGEEIKKEVKRQGISVEAFADRICIERQSVYDIFKRSHIATDKLAEISRVLNRDFFHELSLLYNAAENQSDVNGENSETTISRLLPADELHVVSNGEAIDEVVDEYMTSERGKPLVVFYATDTNFEVDYMLGRWERKGWKGEADTARDIHRDTMFQEWGDNLKIEQTPHYTVLIYNGTDYSRAIDNTIGLMETPGRHIVLLVPVVNTLSRGKAGGLVYDDIAEGCFRVWNDKAHFVVAQDEGSKYLRIREYYHAYLGDGIIDRLVKTIAQSGDFERRLLDLTAGSGLLTATEIMPTDNTGLSRILLALPAPDSHERELLFANGVNNTPHLDMWIDIRNGYLADYQYREHPLTVPTGIISVERLDRKPKPEVKAQPQPPRVLMPEVTPGTQAYATTYGEVIDALSNLDPNNLFEETFGDEYEEENGFAPCDINRFNVAVSRDRIVMSDIFIARGAVEPYECLRLIVDGVDAVAKLIIFFRVDYHSGDDFTYELYDAIIDYFIEQGYDTFDSIVPLLKSLDIEFTTQSNL